MATSGRSLFFRLTAFLGLVIFAIMLWRIGPDVIWAELPDLSGRTLALLFALRAVYWLFRTWIRRTIYADYDTPYL